jgi:hypothetical protein
MTLHFGVYNSITGKFGRIEGPANGKTVKVHWEDEKKTVETVSIGRNIRKVLEGSIEHKALVEPQTCMWLLREQPAEFFSILINYRVYEAGSSLDERKLLGEPELSKPDRVRNRAKQGISLREGIKDARGNALFSDFESFNRAWSLACKDWALSQNPPVIVPEKRSKSAGIKPNLDIQIEPNLGSVAAGSEITLEEALELEEKELAEWFRNTEPNTVFEKLLKHAFNPAEKFSFDKEDWRTLIHEHHELKEKFSIVGMKKTISLALQQANREVAAVLISYCLAVSFELDSRVSLDLSTVSAIKNQAGQIALLSREGLSTLWVKNICEKLVADDITFSAKEDHSLVPSLITIPGLSSANRDELLSDYSDWLIEPQTWANLSHEMLSGELQQILASLDGPFTIVRLNLLETALRNNVRLDTLKYFQSLELAEAIRNPRLVRILFSPELSESLTRSVFTEYINSSGPFEFRELLGFLDAGDQVLNLLEKWNMSEMFRKRIQETFAEPNSKYHSFLYPLEMQLELTEAKDSASMHASQLAALEKRAKVQADQLNLLEDELNKLNRHLQAANDSNNELLFSRVSSAIYTTAKAFAGIARLVRLEGGILPASQISATVDLKLKDVGIVPIQKPGDRVPFDSSLMQPLQGKPKPQEIVEIVDPVYELVFQGNQLLLTPALVRCIMET